MTATGKYLNLKIDPFLVYPGAKWSMAEWIISNMPPHRIYVEPFAGSGAVFFNKQPAAIETLNDIDGDIVNLFRCMRESLEQLLVAIELTPWSREEFDASGDREGLAQVERARRFLVRCWQSHKPKLGQKTGWKKECTGLARKNYTMQWARLRERIALAAARLKMAQIENRCALDVIKRHNAPDVLLYVDPPYILGTRTPGLYVNDLSMFEHHNLLKLLREHKGMALISALHHDLYETGLSGWTKKTFQSCVCTGRKNEEILWMNPRAVEQLNK